MKRQKHRVEPKIESGIMDTNPFSFKTNNVSKVDCNAGQLSGAEDTTQSDSGSAPFILVDSAHLRTGQQLQTALTKREKKRMKHVQRQCCILPLLEYTKPALEVQPTTPSEKAAKDDLDFQEDFQLLTIAHLKKDIEWEDPLAICLKTPLAHTSSSEDIHKSASRMKNIREQLENLCAKQQQRDLLNMELNQAPAASRSEPPRIKREATFNIAREEQTLIPQLLTGYYYAPESTACQQLLNRSRSSSQLPKKPSCLPKARSAADLLEQKFPSVLVDGFQSKNAKESADLSTIIKQIGELLLKLPQDQVDQELVGKRSYSFLVTIEPELYSPGMKSSFVSKKNSDPLLADQSPSAHNSVISIFSLASTNGANSSFSTRCMDAKGNVIDPLLGSNPLQLNGSSQSLTDNRSSGSGVATQALQGSSRTFLKFPSKLLKKLRM